MAKKIIKARLKQRTDTQADWAANNPVLLEGELGLITDDKNLYKVGDGVTAWNDLPFRGFDGTLVHETGDSDNAAMSQRGVTQALAKLKERMVEKVPGKGLSTEDYTTEEKNTLANLQKTDAEQSAKLTELSAEKEDKANKVTVLSDESTDEQYPSAKAVYALKERISENEVLIEDLQNTKIEKENDDYYPKMAVGLADNLAGVDVVDSEINFRRSGGGAITDGVARIEAIKGNSVVWNQQNNPYLTEYVQKWLALNGNSYSITAEVDKTEWAAISKSKEWREGHYYYFALNVTGTPTSGLYMNAADKTVKPNTPLIVQISAASTSAPALRLEAGNVGVTFSFQAIDLTQMFNSGNEPTTIEEFYQRIPMGVDLNVYNEGEVIHMDVQSIESVGVNQWDEEWELGRVNPDTGTLIVSTKDIRSKNFIRVIPGKDYYFIGSSQYYVVYYDKDYEHVDWWSISPNRVLTIPNNVHYVKLSRLEVTTYKGDICINLSDPSINGKYYPHIKRVEDLSIIRKYFPNGMRSAGSAHDEIRYNKESGKWEKVVRIGEVDMGTLTWAKSTDTFGDYFHAKVTDAVKTAYDNVANLMNTRYLATSAGSRSGDKIMYYYAVNYNGQVNVKDSSYTDAASFKAAMQGVILYYELAEPIVTELDEADQFKDLDYKVWNAGTEKAIAEGKSAPLAADITYGFNAIGKIKELESLVAALRSKVGI